ncbi:MAG: hypothetical protein M1822_009593 [Bathelium mastoideum]|nr:MAG: hypothetical protein M1822_009593 [Bathelium mastoideum]
MREQRIFPAIRDSPERRRIWRRLRRTRFLIPSLFTFRKDVKYLRPCALIVQTLFKTPHKRFRGTIRNAAEQAFSTSNQRRDTFRVQKTETTWISVTGDIVDQFEFGYQQLFLYAMRHVFDMIRECPLKEDGEPTPVSQVPDQEAWYRFGNLAHDLGFESSEIDRLRALDPDDEKARTALLTGRKPENFRYNKDDFEQFVVKIVRMYRSARKIEIPNKRPRMLTDEGSGESLDRRCGRHWSSAYRADRHFLFLSSLNARIKSRGSSVSSLFVRKSVYVAFFGVAGKVLRSRRKYTMIDGGEREQTPDTDVMSISDSGSGSALSEADENMNWSSLEPSDGKDDSSSAQTQSKQADSRDERSSRTTAANTQMRRELGQSGLTAAEENISLQVIENQSDVPAELTSGSSAMDQGSSMANALSNENTQLIEMGSEPSANNSEAHGQDRGTTNTENSTSNMHSENRFYQSKNTTALLAPRRSRSLSPVAEDHRAKKDTGDRRITEKWRKRDYPRAQEHGDPSEQRKSQASTYIEEINAMQLVQVRLDWWNRDNRSWERLGTFDNGDLLEDAIRNTSQERGDGVMKLGGGDEIPH